MLSTWRPCWCTLQKPKHSTYMHEFIVPHFPLMECIKCKFCMNPLKLLGRVFPVISYFSRVILFMKSMEDPHLVFGRVPEPLRLANSESHAQLQEGATTRTYNTAPQLYERREEELQRDELGSHTEGSFYEQTPQNWRLVSCN